MIAGLHRFLAALFTFALCVGLSAQGHAEEWTLEGEKRLVLHARTGEDFPIGTVAFKPRADGSQDFEVRIDPEATTTYFLSMRNFRCVEGEEITCHVPYPYPIGGGVTLDDLTWLEHGLLFLTKSPGEFGAKFENGLYFRLERTGSGLRGIPQGIDLEYIGSPPDDQTIPPYLQVDRYDEAEGDRFISYLTIE